jgi:hypothetical protein
MSIEEDIKNVLFQIGKDIKIHKIDSQNSIIEIDYDKYVNAIIDLINKKG